MKIILFYVVGETLSRVRLCEAHKFTPWPLRGHLGVMHREQAENEVVTG